MRAKEIPVFIVTGFLESGKTKFILDTLQDRSFTNGDNILILATEEGIEEFDEEELKKKYKCSVVMAETDDFSGGFFKKLAVDHRPDKIIIELNGMYKIDDLMDQETPDNFVVAQIITIINAETYITYCNNMKNVAMDQVRYSDTVIVNRCDQNTDKKGIRKIIKPVNRKAQIIFEGKDGSLMPFDEQDDLPYDITKDVIEIEDDDFGIFYLDAMDHPENYNGKTVVTKAVAYKDAKRLPRGCFVPGRFAMTCCANDIGFVGIMCKVPLSQKEPFEKVKNRDWVNIRAKVGVEWQHEIKGKGPIFYLESIAPAEPAKEDIVYFT